MERQPILRKALHQYLVHPFRILAVLKTEDEVIGVPNFGGQTAQMRLHFVLEPLVKHVVQVNIGQQGADDLPLPGSRFGDQEPTVFDDPDVYPFLNQPKDAAIANPSFDKRHELAPHNRVKVPLDVGFEHIRYRTATNRPSNGVERVVCTEVRPEPVGAWKKILLVNRIEHRHRGLLYDLVLESWNRDRALFSVLLRDIDPTQRLRAVLAAHEAIVERRNVPPHVLLVFPVRDLVHTRARVLPQT